MFDIVFPFKFLQNIASQIGFKQIFDLSLLFVPLPRMALGVGLSDVVYDEPDVSPHGVERLVSEELLDVVDVRVPPYHLDGATTPERVRGYLFRKLRLMRESARFLQLVAKDKIPKDRR